MKETYPLLMKSKISGSHLAPRFKDQFPKANGKKPPYVLDCYLMAIAIGVHHFKLFVM